jgi:CPA2 family monovalent cation:H+ antiporter-2
VPHAEGFKGLLIFLMAAGVIIPLFHRARISAVLGFLIVGVLLGPYAMGRLAESHPWLWYITFDDPKRATVAAELGIIFLLFTLGLEISLGRLWQLRRYVLGVGLLQVALTAVAIGLFVRWFVAVRPAGIVLGLCLALSSTAVVMQILVAQRRAATPVGRIALSVLLFQDLMVVPILFSVGLLGGGPGRSFWSLVLPFMLALAAVPLLLVVGRYIVRPLFYSAGLTGSREIILALALLIVLGIAGVTGEAGLSMALGAFVAGLLLSESEYKHQIEVDIEPIKNLLLGIFFITVGMSVDLEVVANYAGQIAVGVVVLILFKTVILYGVARAFRVARGPSIEVALLLAQAGEFAFVVIGIAQATKLISPQLASSTIAVAALSMMLTPVLAVFARQLGDQYAPKDHGAPVPPSDGSEFVDHVVIGGFGRVGQTIAKMLEAENVAFVALDANAELVAEHNKAGRAVYFGDASHVELLKRAGAHNARAFVVTLDSSGTAEQMVKEVRKLRPDVPVFARAKDAGHAAKLTAHGAMGAIPEFEEASLQLAGRVLEALGLSEDAVVERLANARREALDRLTQPAK